MTEEMTSRKIFAGVGWSTISTITNGLVQILRLSILSRFLEKSDFGIVALLTFTLGLVQLFSDLGFSSAIMSQKNLVKQDFISLFEIQFLIYNFALISLSLSSTLIASYYSNDAIGVMLPIVLLELFFISIGRLYETVLQKEMRFKTIAIRNIVSAFLSLPLAVVLAKNSYGAYSLILSTLAHAIIINFWNFVAGQSTYRFRLQRIDLKRTRCLMKVGGFQMGTQIMDFFSSKIDIIIIGLYFDVDELGLYNLAKEIVAKFTMIINAVINKVLLPVLTALQDDLYKLREMFCKLIRKVSLVNAATTSFVFLFADVIVYRFYGEKFMDATFIVRMTAVCAFIGLSCMPNGLLAISMKKTDVTFLYTTIKTIVTIPILFLFGWISMNITLGCILVISILGFFLNWYMLLKKTILLRLSDYLGLFRSSVSLFAIVSMTLTPIWWAYGDYHSLIFLLPFAFMYVCCVLICVFITKEVTIYEFKRFYTRK